MANNYLQFSVSIPLRSVEEDAWCDSRLRELDAQAGDSDTEKLSPDIKNVPSSDYDCFVSFQYTVEKNNLWLYAEESGDPDELARFIQAFLRKFRKDEAIWFSWSYTCSKMRENEFGGGAVIVTAKRSYFNSPGDFISKQSKKLGFMSADGSNVLKKAKR